MSSGSGAVSSTTKTLKREDDDENPEIDLSARQKKGQGMIKMAMNMNPSTKPTVMAMFFNFGWAFSFAYGLTGRLMFFSPAVGFSAMLLTALGWISEAKEDYSKWELSRKYRERNMPDIVLPRTIFDWEEFSKVNNQTPPYTSG